MVAFVSFQVPIAHLGATACAGAPRKTTTDPATSVTTAVVRIKTGLQESACTRDSRSRQAFRGTSDSVPVPIDHREGRDVGQDHHDDQGEEHPRRGSVLEHLTGYEGT